MFRFSSVFIFLAIFQFEVYPAIIRVVSVATPSYASEAGIEANDWILTVNGKKLTDIDDAKALILSSDKLEFDVMRGKNNIKLNISKNPTEEIGLEFEFHKTDDYASLRKFTIDSENKIAITKASKNLQAAGYLSFLSIGISLIGAIVLFQGHESGAYASFIGAGISLAVPLCFISAGNNFEKFNVQTEVE